MAAQALNSCETTNGLDMRYLSLLITLALSSTIAHAQTPSAMAVASAHSTATAAGINILEHGGNAFDAAVAVSATLAVVEPYSSGMGGGGFWLLHRELDKRDIMIDGRERAPLKAHRTMYQDTKGEVIEGLSVDGPLAAGIPGEAAALVHIAAQYGRLPLKVTLAPAIRAAHEGFAVTEHYRQVAKFRLEVLRKSPAAAAIFLYRNDVPPVGYIIKQPDLAHTLEQFALKGRTGFYSGEVAKKLIAGINAAGGIWSEKDLQTYQIKERTPTRFSYAGYTITSASPPSSGGVVLTESLNTLSQLPYTQADSLHRIHYVVESIRRAYRDRAEYLGDPDFVAIPLKHLTSMAYAKELAQSIEPDKATPSEFLNAVAPAPSGNHTTHFSILDKEGNRVAATLSVNYPFGSGFVPPGTGVLLNDEMDDFSAKPDVPNVYGLVGAEANAIDPGKRMLSSMSPTFVEGPQRVAILGTPGGSRIITMVLQGILAVTENQNAETIVSQPRYHHQYLPDTIQYEAGAISDDQGTQLEAMGYNLRLIEGGYGNMQVVLWDKANNNVSAASDPRGIGTSRVK